MTQATNGISWGALVNTVHTYNGTKPAEGKHIPAPHIEEVKVNRINPFHRGADGKIGTNEEYTGPSGTQRGLDWHLSQITGSLAGWFCYVPEMKQWYMWNVDTHTWRRDDRAQIVEAIKGYARDLARHAEAKHRANTIPANGGKLSTPYSEDGKWYIQWSHKLIDPSYVSKVLESLSTDEAFLAPLSWFDADPYTLNTPGGFVDLKSGELLPIQNVPVIHPDFFNEEDPCPTRGLGEFRYDSHLLRPMLGDEVYDSMSSKELEEVFEQEKAKRQEAQAAWEKRNPTQYFIADRENLVMKSTTVAPAPGETPLYDRLLSQLFVGQPEVAEYFDTMMGASLVGQPTQALVYLRGVAGSGKSTLLNVALQILGNYATSMSPKIIVQGGRDEHPTEYMQLQGVRMAVMSEVDDGQKLASAKMKALTGEATVTGRLMGKDFVTFPATHTLWMMANDRLQVRNSDDGVWRRLKNIECNFALPASERIDRFDSLIVSQEGPAILHRWIQAASRYLTEGHWEPAAIQDAINSYITSQDTVEAWLEGLARPEADESPESYWTSNAALRESYMKWCKQEGVTPLGEQNFGQTLTNKGVTSKVKNQLGKSVRGRIGVSIPPI